MVRSTLADIILPVGPLVPSRPTTSSLSPRTLMAVTNLSGPKLVRAVSDVHVSLLTKVPCVSSQAEPSNSLSQKKTRVNVQGLYSVEHTSVYYPSRNMLFVSTHTRSYAKGTERQR